MHEQERARRSPRIAFAGRTMPLPRHRWQRMVVGGALVVGGIFAFLPVLGIWMIPLGVLVLSVDLPVARRLRRRVEVWWGRRRLRKRQERDDAVAREGRTED